jgi:MCM N-terminal domain
MADMSRRPVVLEPHTDAYDGRQIVGAYEIEGSAARSRFREFFRNFRLGNVYPYRDALIRHWNRSEFYVEVDLAHVHEYDEVLLQSLQVPPSLLSARSHRPLDTLDQLSSATLCMRIINANLPYFNT